ncbi:hypothetical protein RUM44_000693 [Polyplax serrata]|uniref:Uncharacterized protein n=1 Tax=Polyplax serrata TaxID=468196 RepID=A0ABR1B8S6_POLSC
MERKSNGRRAQVRNYKPLNRNGKSNLTLGEEDETKLLHRRTRRRQEVEKNNCDNLRMTLSPGTDLQLIKMRDQSKETNEEITSDLTNKTKDTRQDFRDDLNAS